MRLLCACAIAALLSLPAVVIGGGSVQAKIVCGNFGEGFTCKSDPGAGGQFGKNATPGAAPQAPEASPPAAAMPQGTWQGQTVPGGAGQGAAGVPADPSACQNGGSARRPTVAARRTPNFWAAIACVTPRRPAATDWRRTPSPNPAGASKRSSPAPCARTA